MSVIWRGYDETLGRPVAVKVLSPRLADDQTFRDRLRREALAAARLCHPHITGIFDFGESPLNEHLTVPYVVMELNDGESVADRLGRQGPLPWREAVTATAEVAAALATAHARGVVHRDVTPANVMLTGAGAKVVDFGISAIVGERDAAPDGSLLGTPAYLAPERLAGAQVSAATDVYALGLLLYRALTGRLPWPAETTADALRAHLYADPAPLPPQPGMPDTVAELCRRCLAKTPADRPQATEAARTLAAAVGIQPTLPPARERPEDAPPPFRATVTPPTTRHPTKRTRRAARFAFARSFLGRSTSDHPAGGSAASDHAASGKVASDHAAGGKVASGDAVGGSTAFDHAAGGKVVSGHAAGGSTAFDHAAGGKVASGHAAGGSTAFDHAAGGSAASDRLAGGNTVSGRLKTTRDRSSCGNDVSESSAVAGASADRFRGRWPRAASGAFRLRVGLKVGSWLRLGSVRPLGGGLFAGGGVARSVLAGYASLRGRHRMQAALVTAALLATAGIGWATTREPPDAEQAQAAGAATAPGSPTGTVCSVRYQLKRDSGRDYEALLTVATTDDVGRSPWRVVFAYPGSQRLTGGPRAVTQSGRKVVAKGHGTLRTFTLRGAYRGNNPLPLSFALDGRKCRAEVLGTVAINDDEPVSEAAGNGKRQPTRSVGSGGNKRHRPPRDSGTPQKRVQRTKPAAPQTPSAPALPPTARKGTGFSLAL